MRTYLRVGAIIFYEGKLVTTLMKKKEELYHVLPGGGVEEGETIYDALKREVREELNLDIEKLKLAYIRELNLKIEGGGRGVEFYFFVEDYSGKPKKGFDPEEKESSLLDINFIDLKELNNINFHPQQLKKILKTDKENNFKETKHLGIYDYP